MYKLEEKTRREEQRFQNPSFSSTLLDKIYRSIDEGGERKDPDMKFYTETTPKKQSRNNAKCDRAVQEKSNQNLSRALKESEKVRTQRKAYRDYDLEQDVQFFSSGSSSSDSSSGLLSSSSDTESMYGTRSRVSCFAPSRPKPVRTSVATERSEKTRNAIASDNEEGLIKSKSRAVKIYNNLKKVKQPISPGGKLSSFLNSLFTPKKTTTTASSYDYANVNVNAERRNASTCSSASSFSRSCLSKNSPSTREKLRNGVKRTVHFYPVSVIVDEDSQPCGHKAVPSVQAAWKIGSKKKVVEEEEVINKSRRVEEAAREFLREYHRNNEILRRKIEEEEDDDASSCSSSDLFELDHLAVTGKDRYCEELPVFETTRFSANRAIANSRIL